jgi:hypothetical protein
MQVRRSLAPTTYLSSLLLLVVWAGCGPSLGAGGCGELPCGSERVRSWTTQTTFQGELDVLFVLDDTPAIAPHLETLRASLPLFARTFERIPRGTPSLHVRFVPAALPDAGCDAPGSRAAACGLDGESLQTDLCGARPNVSGSLADAFACLGELGATACGPARPLEAMRRALADGAAFLRDDAYLVVMIVAGADDASTTGGAPAPIEGYVDSLRALKPDPTNQILVSIIGPDGDGDGCASGDPGAAAPRLSAFVRAFGRTGLFQTLCSADWSAALAPVVEETTTSTEPTCLAGLQDLDPAEAGLQADCVVEDGLAPRPIPRCDDGPPPCWRMEASPVCPGGWHVTIDRGADWCPLAPTRTTYTCLGCLRPNDPACAGPSQM